MERNRSVVTRMAPSPTGQFHVGSIRTALFSYLYARQHGGTFILRCEDTDPARSKKEYEDYFLEVFRWLGLEFDEYHRQSERTHIYKKYLEKLIAEDKAYLSKEEVVEEGKRDSVIRFRNPGRSLTFHDEVLGDVTFDTTELGDFVIARDIDSPLYHFTVVVDDFEMGVTHVIRGQDHVSNTPRQILIQEAIGAPRPVYAHASIILNEKRAKLSKRDPKVRPTLEYRDEGYLPEAILNFMALIGWNPGTEKEIFTLQELVKEFSLERMQKQGGVFKPEKLEWVNREHIKMMHEDALIDTIKKYMPTTVTSLPGYSDERLRAIVPVIVERISHFGEIREMDEAGELAYFFTTPACSAKDLVWKKAPDPARTKENLEAVLALVADISETDFGKESVGSAVSGLAEKVGRGEILWPMRYALSGREKSPDPFTLAGILGKAETCTRLSTAISCLSSTQLP